MNKKIKKEDLCPCGSGKKYKNCCIHLKHHSHIKQEKKNYPSKSKDEIFTNVKKINNTGFHISDLDDNIEKKIEFSHMMAGRKITNTKPYYGQFHDEDGILTYEGEIKDNIMHGNGKLFYSNGNIEYEGQFNYGYLTGNGIYYYKNGNKRWKGIFKELVVFGSEALQIFRSSYSYADRFGRIIKGKAYRENGILEYEGQFNYLGIPEGYGKKYDDHGVLEFIGNFKDGKPIGKNEIDSISSEVREIIGTYFEFNNLVDIHNDLDKSPYDILLGVKYFILGDLFQLKSQFIKKESNKTMIEFLIDDIKELTFVKSVKDKDKIKKKYINVIEEVKEAKLKSGLPLYDGYDNFFVDNDIENAKKQEINDEDLIALKCCYSIIQEIDKAYHNVINAKNPLFNYYLIFTFLNVVMELLENTKSKINSVIYKPTINIYIDDKGHLVGYTIVDDAQNILNELSNPIVNICSYSVAEQGDYLKDIYEKLTKQGRILFSTGELMYANMKNCEGLTFDYWPYIAPYIKCIECELKDRIGEILLKHIPGLKPPLTLGSFNFAFEKHRDIINKILNIKVSSKIITSFDYLTSLRNLNTHDNIFSYEECIKVRKILVEDKLLETIIQIEPLNKTIISSEDFDIYDNELLNSASFKGNLEEVIDYKNIKDPLFNDSKLGICLLNNCSNILINNPFIIDEEGILERYISSKVARNTFGFLSVNDISIENDLYQMEYNYSGLQVRSNGVNILYRANIVQEKLSLAGVIRVRDNEGNIEVFGDTNIFEIKKILYKNLLVNKKHSEVEKIYKQYYRLVLKKLINLIENEHSSKQLILKTINSEYVWLTRGNDIIINSNKLIKELLKSLYKNFNTYDKLTNKIIAKACYFCIENMHEIYGDKENYLYPYAIIKVRGEEVIDISLEKIKANDNKKTIFEIVYN